MKTFTLLLCCCLASAVLCQDSGRNDVVDQDSVVKLKFSRIPIKMAGMKRRGMRRMFGEALDRRARSSPGEVQEQVQIVESITADEEVESTTADGGAKPASDDVLVGPTSFTSSPYGYPNLCFYYALQGVTPEFCREENIAGFNVDGDFSQYQPEREMEPSIAGPTAADIAALCDWIQTDGRHETPEFCFDSLTKSQRSDDNDDKKKSTKSKKKDKDKSKSPVNTFVHAAAASAGHQVGAHVTSSLLQPNRPTFPQQNPVRPTFPQQNNYPNVNYPGYFPPQSQFPPYSPGGGVYPSGHSPNLHNPHFSNSFGSNVYSYPSHSQGGFFGGGSTTYYPNDGFSPSFSSSPVVTSTSFGGGGGYVNYPNYDNSGFFVRNSEGAELQVRNSGNKKKFGNLAAAAVAGGVTLAALGAGSRPNRYPTYYGGRPQYYYNSRPNYYYNNYYGNQGPFLRELPSSANPDSESTGEAANEEGLTQQQPIYYVMPVNPYVYYQHRRPDYLHPYAYNQHLNSPYLYQQTVAQNTVQDGSSEKDKTPDVEAVTGRTLDDQKTFLEEHQDVLVRDKRDAEEDVEHEAPSTVQQEEQPDQVQQQEEQQEEIQQQNEPEQDEQQDQQQEDDDDDMAKLAEAIVMSLEGEAGDDNQSPMEVEITKDVVETNTEARDNGVNALLASTALISDEEEEEVVNNDEENVEEDETDATLMLRNQEGPAAEIMEVTVKREPIKVEPVIDTKFDEDSKLGGLANTATNAFAAGAGHAAGSHLATSLLTGGGRPNYGYGYGYPPQPAYPYYPPTPTFGGYPGGGGYYPGGGGYYPGGGSYFGGGGGGYGNVFYVRNTALKPDQKPVFPIPTRFLGLVGYQGFQNNGGGGGGDDDVPVTTTTSNSGSSFGSRPVYYYYSG